MITAEYQDQRRRHQPPDGFGLHRVVQVEVHEYRALVLPSRYFQLNTANKVKTVDDAMTTGSRYSRWRSCSPTALCQAYDRGGENSASRQYYGQNWQRAARKLGFLVIFNL